MLASFAADGVRDLRLHVQNLARGEQQRRLEPGDFRRNHLPPGGYSWSEDGFLLRAKDKKFAPGKSGRHSQSLKTLLGRDGSVSPLICGENVGMTPWSFLVEPGLHEMFEILDGFVGVGPLGRHPQLGTLALPPASSAP